MPAPIKPPPMTSSPPVVATVKPARVPTSSRPPAEWQRPSPWSVLVFVACVGALMWAVHAKVDGAEKALLTGLAAVLLYVTQGPRRVMPPDTTTVSIEPPHGGDS